MNEEYAILTFILYFQRTWNLLSSDELVLMALERPASLLEQLGGCLHSSVLSKLPNAARSAGGAMVRGINSSRIQIHSTYNDGRNYRS